MSNATPPPTAAAADATAFAPARTWAGREAPADVVAELVHELGVAPLTARILALRGMRHAADVQPWLAKRMSDLAPPERIHDMERAAQVLADAINRRRRILIHGDYDVDGSTSAALLALFVRACSHEAVVWIPHRRIDGYGLSESSMQAVKDHRSEVMVTVDCGIADGGWAARIEAETGCTVLITDHHLPQSSLPRCTAVVNPNHPACTFPDKALAGVGVAWKLAWATAKVLSGGDKVSDRLRANLMESLALVAVGTVADCAPLTGENRILVHHGLLALAKTANHGLRALLGHAGLADGAIAAGDVGWRMSPLLNAAGRVGSAMDNIRLLTAADPAEAAAVAESIVAENEERKRLTQILTADLIAAAGEPAMRDRAGLVFAGEGWHQGVVGIVASRLVEAYGKPAAVIAIEDGKGKGSLRSVAQVHLGEALDACRHLLVKGGGHAMAAGLNIEAGQVPAFSQAFDAFCRLRLSGSGGGPQTAHDGTAAISELDTGFFAALDQLGPFGIGNPEPVLRVAGAAVVSRPRLFGKGGDHLKGALTDAGGGMREFIAWRAKERYAAWSRAGARFDLLVKPEAARFRGELQPRLVVVDGRSL